MKKIGMLYCGGCNPRFNREHAYNRIVTSVNDCADVGLAKTNEAYDMLVIIGGCTNCCASYDQYYFIGEPYKVREEADVDSVINLLKEKIKKH